MKLLIIDNYDSFIYNIVGLLQRAAEHPGLYPGGSDAGAGTGTVGKLSSAWKENLEWDVVMNDSISKHLAEHPLTEYSGVILSPGPGLPSEAGEMSGFIKRYAGVLPILGICLGCQAIAEAFGGKLENLGDVKHGHRSELRNVDDTDPVVGNIRGGIGRYHSWVVSRDVSGDGIIVTAEDEEGHVMSIRHQKHRLYGVQYHPESIITEAGLHLVLNFLRICNL